MFLERETFGDIKVDKGVTIRLGDGLHSIRFPRNLLRENFSVFRNQLRDVKHEVQEIFEHKAIPRKLFDVIIC